MASELTLGIIGVGNLGGALAEGVLAAGAVNTVVASDVSSERLKQLEAQLGPNFRSSSLSGTAEAASLLVIAVKPHILSKVLDDIKESLNFGCAVISVAAGVPLTRIEEGLLANWPVIRVMPNLAMLVRESASAICTNQHVSKEQLETATSVFEAVGIVVHVEESQMHAVTGLTGSGPAYVSVLLEGLAAGAVKKGLQPALAQKLACQLLFGTAKLLKEKGWHPAVLKDLVTTPGGTTIAGLNELELHAVRGALMAAVGAASERSEELAS